MGDVITDSNKLIARSPEAFSRSGIEVMLRTSVEDIDTENRTVTLSNGRGLSYDRLVLATGARARDLAVEGRQLKGIFFLRDLSDALRIKSFLKDYACRRALVVGGGFVGLELCEAFRQLNMDTMLMNRSPLPMRRLGDDFGERIVHTLKAAGVTYMAETMPVGFAADKSGGIQVTTDRETLQADIVVIGIGVQPEVELALDAGVALGTTGAIAVDDRMQTSREDIFAAGDCCQSHHLVSGRPTYLPLGDVANRQGRVAGTNIGGGQARFPGVVGSSCLKVFDLQVATTGLNEIEAAEAGFSPAVVTISGHSRAHSYPGARPLSLRMIADAGSGRLLGAQGIGTEGAVSRINTLSLAAAAAMTVDQLAMADFAYAPPFSGSWDPIQIAAQKLAKS